MPNYPWEDNYKKYPIRVIDSKKPDIYELQGDQYVLIGHTLDWCQELESVCEQATSKAEEYYEMLIEHGIIEPVKSESEIMQEQQAAMFKEQQEINTQLLQTIQNLSSKIDELSNPEPKSKSDKEVTANGNNGHNNGLSKSKSKSKSDPSNEKQSTETGEVVSK